MANEIEYIHSCSDRRSQRNVFVQFVDGVIGMDVMRWWNAYFYTFIFNFKLFSPLWKFDNILWPTIYVSFPPNCSLNDNTFFVEQSSSWMLVLLHLHYIEPIDTFSIFNESFKRTHSNVCIHENVSCQNASCIQLTGAKYKFREVFITIFYFPLSFNVTFCSMSFTYSLVCTNCHWR